MTTAALSRRKRIVFALGGVALACLVSFGALLSADLYLHGRYERSAGVNIWGYRGPVVGRKGPGEIRVVFLGGSTAFGYGVTWDRAIPAQLEARLNEGLPEGIRRFSVVNLAYNNEGAYSFRFTLDDYRNLDYDIVCLYEGYNDLMGNPTRPNTSVFRHESPVFRLTGYLPIFPVVFREKASALRFGGDLEGYYRELRGEQTKTVFRPNLADRAAAGVLDMTASVGESLERQLGKVTEEPGRQVQGGEVSGCKYPWGEYCQSMFAAVDRALAMGKRVAVITQPYLGGEFGERHMDQQRTMSEALARRYAGNPGVEYVNAGDAVDMTDPAYGYDHMHLTAPANGSVAAALIQPIRALAQVKP